MNRREFLGAAGAFAAFGGCVTQKKVAMVDNPKASPIWCYLVQFGRNMWGDLEFPPARDNIKMKILTDAEHAELCKEQHWRHDRMHFEYPFYRELIDRLKASGCNMIMLDVGEGVRYPSHPELALKDSWEPERLQREINRLRGLGFEVVPKLNFSCCHNSWLGPYARMVSTPKYYEVCREVIDDLIEIFDGTRYVHLGMDEEDIPQYQMGRTSMVVMRMGDLWWDDLNFLVNEVERHGVRAWIWSDVLRSHSLKTFCRRMPRSVIQSPWTYDTNEPVMADPLVKMFKTLADAGYDTVPCGSNIYGNVDNFAGIAGFCRKNISSEHLRGFIFAPWHKTISPLRRIHWQATDCMAEARRRYAGG